MSERLACKAVGLARSTYRRLPAAQTPADPDAEMRAWLRAYATKHPCHGFRRAWAALRHDEGREVNKKKVHRLWREEGLQVKIRSPRKRAGVSSVPPVAADAPNVVWAIDFQFDSTTDGKAIKIASMIDEHTRESLLNIVERSITAERLVAELEMAFTVAGGPPKVLRMDIHTEFAGARPSPRGFDRSSRYADFLPVEWGGWPGTAPGSCALLRTRRPSVGGGRSDP
ncbi:IS3 family transposase [Mycobacterium riyadhense]|uniref:IS3 family transposase n=1 Tax=Mycobacterium riyadhense TaxID=486698 RepID=UPI00195BB9DB|nr:IS3 family transposase [Mycobacterium riyadhense]